MAHCNLRCYGCNHFCAYAPEWFASPEAFRRDVDLLARYVRVRWFKFLGGEPLLHPDLLEFVRIVRESGLADRVRVGTNGLLLARQPASFWREVDSVVVTVYPSTEARVDLELFRRRAREHGTQLLVNRRPRFYEPVVDFPMKDPRLVRLIFASCVMARSCTTLCDGALFRCSTAPCLDYYLHRLGYPGGIRRRDGLRIESRDDMPDRIRRYLSSRRPLEACRFCLSMVGPIVPHRQLTRQDTAHPARSRRAEDLVDRTVLRRRLMLMRFMGWLRPVPASLRRALGLTSWKRLTTLARLPRLEIE